jgi:hypothetical protein
MLALLSLASASCDFGDEGSKESSAAQSEAVPERVEIQSSLDSLSILPRRIARNVTTSLPASEVREVRFRLDGLRLWTDSSPPFAYGEEGAELGTWMGSGPHRFTVAAIATDGSRAKETVIAHVRKTETNDDLWNVWGRLSKAELETPTPPGDSPEPTALVYFSDRIMSVGRSPDQAFAYEYWLKGHTLHLGTAFFSGAPGESARFAGWGAGGIQCLLAHGRPATHGHAGKGESPDGSRAKTSTLTTSSLRPKRTPARSAAGCSRGSGRDLGCDAHRARQRPALSPQAAPSRHSWAARTKALSKREG